MVPALEQTVWHGLPRQGFDEASKRPASTTRARGDRCIRRGGVFRLRAITTRLPTGIRSGWCGVIRFSAVPRGMGGRALVGSPLRRRVRGGFSPPSTLKRIFKVVLEPRGPVRRTTTAGSIANYRARGVRGLAKPGPRWLAVIPDYSPGAALRGRSCVDTASLIQVSFFGSCAPFVGVAVLASRTRALVP